jgi:hypothetical protein
MVPCHLASKIYFSTWYKWQFTFATWKYFLIISKCAICLEFLNYNLYMYAKKPRSQTYRITLIKFYSLKAFQQYKKCAIISTIFPSFFYCRSYTFWIKQSFHNAWTTNNTSLNIKSNRILQPWALPKFTNIVSSPCKLKFITYTMKIPMHYKKLVIIRSN